MIEGHAAIDAALVNVLLAMRTVTIAPNTVKVCMDHETGYTVVAIGIGVGDDALIDALQRSQHAVDPQGTC